MFKSPFNNNRTSDSNGKSKLGLVKEEPVRLCSIPSAYVYLDALCSLAEGLNYMRLGSVSSEQFIEPVDKYIFTHNGTKFCEIFIYSYHETNAYIIPDPFKELNPNADDEVFRLDENGRRRYLNEVVELILIKNNIIEDIFERFSLTVLNNLMSELGYGEELEELILDEFKKFVSTSPEMDADDFIQPFVEEFHNKKLGK